MQNELNDSTRQQKKHYGGSKPVKLSVEARVEEVGKKASGLKTPKAHKKHTDGIPCGCWTGQKNVTICRWCGACYDAWEVVEFAVFRCYDCGGGVPTRITPSPL